MLHRIHKPSLECGPSPSSWCPSSPLNQLFLPSHISFVFLCTLFYLVFFFTLSPLFFFIFLLPSALSGFKKQPGGCFSQAVRQFCPSPVSDLCWVGGQWMICPLSSGTVPEGRCLFHVRGDAKHWLACADRGGAGRSGDLHDLSLWLSGRDSVCEGGAWLLVDPGDLE